MRSYIMSAMNGVPPTTPAPPPTVAAPTALALLLVAPLAGAPAAAGVAWKLHVAV